MVILEKIEQLGRMLYPTGRAFKMAKDSLFDKLNSGLSLSEERAVSDAKLILDSALPDNTNFDASDATQWERRLGLITNVSLTVDERKIAIQRKMNHPGNIKPRQNYRYLERELRAAGFDVYVYENIFPYGSGYYTQDPLYLTGGVGGVDFQHGTPTPQHDDGQHGGGYQNIIANYLEEGLDWSFSTGNNLYGTFFIGGNPLGTFANIDATRKNEFRQLILRLKPVHKIGFLFVNYV